MPVFNLSAIVNDLNAARGEWRDAHGRMRAPGGSREFPSPEALAQIVADLKGLLFPMRLGPLTLRQESEDFYVGHTLNTTLHALLEQVKLELRHQRGNGQGETPATAQQIERQAEAAVQAFAATLPTIRRLLDTDVLAAFHGDPAARSVDEVLLCYPGVHAMIHHRIAHQLYLQGLGLIARICAEQAHAQTGIDIHPGARIGRSFFIDHGTGVVIGETTIIGEHVRIYQAVTLGAKRFPTDADGTLEKGLPRHPIVEDDVVIYAGATILGRITLGKGCTIGGNVWLVDDVPPGAHVVQGGAATRPTDPSAERGC